MTTQSQLILICEKLLGWKFRYSYKDSRYLKFDKTRIQAWHSPLGVRHGSHTSDPNGALPPLTLDLIWDCEERLTIPQSIEYEKQLEKAVNGNFIHGETCLIVPSWHATAEQRLAALVETIGGAK